MFKFIKDYWEFESEILKYALSAVASFYKKNIQFNLAFLLVYFAVATLFSGGLSSDNLNGFFISAVTCIVLVFFVFSGFYFISFFQIWTNQRSVISTLKSNNSSELRLRPKYYEAFISSANKLGSLNISDFIKESDNPFRFILKNISDEKKLTDVELSFSLHGYDFSDLMNKAENIFWNVEKGREGEFYLTHLENLDGTSAWLTVKDLTEEKQFYDVILEKEEIELPQSIQQILILFVIISSYRDRLDPKESDFVEILANTNFNDKTQISDLNRKQIEKQIIDMPQIKISVKWTSRDFKKETSFIFEPKFFSFGSPLPVVDSNTNVKCITSVMGTILFENMQDTDKGLYNSYKKLGVI